MRGEKEAGELSVYASPLRYVASGPRMARANKNPCLHISKWDNRLIQVPSSKGSKAGNDSTGSHHGDKPCAKANHHSRYVRKMNHKAVMLLFHIVMVGKQIIGDLTFALFPSSALPG